MGEIVSFEYHFNRRTLAPLETARSNKAVTSARRSAAGTPAPQRNLEPMELGCPFFAKETVIDAETNREGVIVRVLFQHLVNHHQSQYLVAFGTDRQVMRFGHELRKAGVEL